MSGYEHEVKALIGAAGVPVPRGVVVSLSPAVTSGAGADAGSPADFGAGFAAAAGLAEPLVLKAFGPGLLHKSEAGAVRLGLRFDELGPAAAELAARLRPAGFLVEEQAEPGVELIVGLVRDPAFGPVLLAGLGGVWTEALRDTALRLCPIAEEDARRMLASLRGADLLRGWRGGPPVDVDAVVKLLMTVGGPGGLWERLDLGEFELNPVIAGPSGVIAVDARYVPDPEHPIRDSPAYAAGDSPGSADEPVMDFLPLFEPGAVAVVGASTSRPNFGNMFLGFYRAAGVPLVAVHPTADEVSGVPAVSSLAAAEVDYALVAVPAERCAEVVRQARGVPFVQVMSGGFGEAGRPELEAELVAAARGAGTRLLGPNCMGVYCPRGRQTFVGGGLGPSGTVALISQSGGLAGEVIKVGERRGLAFSRVATVGNAADVTPAELLRWLARDPETRAVGLYLEDPRNGRELYAALRDAPVPVVLLVGGRSGQGRRAAASHTGGLVSDLRIWEAVADQSRAALVTSQDDLIGVLAYFQAHGTRPAHGDGVLVVGPSGGASVLAADAFDRAGVRLGPLPDERLDALRGLGVVATGNPLEIPVGPMGRAGLVADVLDALGIPYADVVAHVNVQAFFAYASAHGDPGEPLYAYTRALAAAQADRPGTRISLVTRNGDCAPAGVEDEVGRIAAAAGIPVYRTMEAAAVAVAAGGCHGVA
ncbi:acetate--CoA ligase family protein [Nonomuraea fuscirosea]|uniref:acetate--CoA ligase family protein n=1 Tax=Nonomuraea fuscirosea TaxID=1291556 RepID=UPI002DDC0DC3|nr:acetate--CoA ligase family protein [Nonomuraea fuscirosea]WSA49504.1 acetate--CoA ligase family protein [Nonomuraea fuscirosea]